MFYAPALPAVNLDLPDQLSQERTCMALGITQSARDLFIFSVLHFIRRDSVKILLCGYFEQVIQVVNKLVLFSVIPFNSVNLKFNFSKSA